ncbi:MAG: amidase family protein [Pseudomonadota bacterium]
MDYSLTSLPFVRNQLPGAAAVLAVAMAASGIPAALAQPAGPVEQRVAASLQRIETRDRDYRAVITLDQQALARARMLDRQRRAPGRLYGEPILLKDNIESVGLPTTAGSQALAENNTGRDARLVSALRSEGAVILGKTNLSEWANFRSEHSSSGWSAVGGQTRNAIDPLRTPCGSSSGSAVAVALGYVRVAIGTETSGSIICPASINGVVGFKPTHGLVSGDGIVPLALTQDTAGPIATDVELAARTLAVMVDPSARDAEDIRRGLIALDDIDGLRGLRFGVYANTLGYDKRRDANLERITALLQAAGATVVPGLRIDPYDGYGADSYDVLLWEFRRDLNAYLAALPNSLSELSLARIIRFNEDNADRELKRFDQSIFIRSQALTLTEDGYRDKRERTRTAMRAEGLDRLFRENSLDALIGVSTSVAWLIDWVNGDASFGRSMAGPAAVAGNPHITLPLAEIEGLPHGISLIGERWKDHRLAAIARLVEREAAP